MFISIQKVIKNQKMSKKIPKKLKIFIFKIHKGAK